MVSSTIWQDEGRYSLIHRPATVSVTQGTVTGPGIYSHTITYTIIHFERRLRFCGSFRITEKVAGLLGTRLGKVVWVAMLVACLRTRYYNAVVLLASAGLLSYSCTVTRQNFVKLS